MSISWLQLLLLIVLLVLLVLLVLVLVLLLSQKSLIFDVSYIFGNLMSSGMQ